MLCLPAKIFALNQGFVVEFEWAKIREGKFLAFDQ